jgi:hypothetical protein
MMKTNPKPKIFIPGNVPSSKNSRVFNIQTKRSFPSKTVQRWMRKSKPFWISERDKFLASTAIDLPPYRVQFTFIRDSRRKFDYINAAQVIQDQMQKFDWIEDDNCDYLIPSFGLYRVDKENAGVEIQVL